MKNTQAARLQQILSHKVAETKSSKVAATKSRKVAVTKSSKINLHMKNSQVAIMPQLAAAAKPYGMLTAKVQVKTVYPYCLISVSAVYCKDSIQVQVSKPHSYFLFISDLVRTLED